MPQGAFAPPSHLNGAYGRAFDRIVMQLLQADPARRPAGAAEVASSLAAALAPRRLRPLGIAVSAGALVLTLVGGTMGIRAMFRGDGKGAEKASAKTLVSNANANANANTTTPPPPEKQATPLDSEPTKPAAPAPVDDDQQPRTKKKHRLVLKAVSDVKELRTAAAKPDASEGRPARARQPSRANPPSQERKKGQRPPCSSEQFDTGMKEAMPPPAACRRPARSDRRRRRRCAAAHAGAEAQVAAAPKILYGSSSVERRPAPGARRFIASNGWHVDCEATSRAPVDCRCRGGDAMLKTFVRTTTCLAVSAAALIAVTTLDAIAGRGRSPSVPETTEPKPAPKPPAPKPTRTAPEIDASPAWRCPMRRPAHDQDPPPTAG